MIACSKWRFEEIGCWISGSCPSSTFRSPAPLCVQLDLEPRCLLVFLSHWSKSARFPSFRASHPLNLMWIWCAPRCQDGCEGPCGVNDWKKKLQGGIERGDVWLALWSVTTGSSRWTKASTWHLLRGILKVDSRQWKHTHTVPSCFLSFHYTPNSWRPQWRCVCVSEGGVQREAFGPEMKHINGNNSTLSL